MHTLWVILTIVLSSITFAALNRARGGDNLPRIVFALAGAFVLVQGNPQTTLLLSVALYLGWLFGHGRYAGAITHDRNELGAFTVLSEKEEIVTDTIMRPLEQRLPLRTWGVLAMSVRYYVWLLPFYYLSLGDNWFYGTFLALGAGPCYLLADVYGDYKWERERFDVDEWAIGEWIFGLWFAFSVLFLHNFNLIFGA